MTEVAVNLPEPQSPKPLPAWISVVLIALCLTAGVWIMHWYVTTDPLSHESRILDPGAASPAPMRPMRYIKNIVQDNQPAIRPQGENGWVIRSPEATMFVLQNKDKPAALGSLRYNVVNFVPEEEQALIYSARRIVRNEAVAKTLNLTPEQLRQLRGLTSQVGMVAAPSDTAHLLELWNEYQTATDKAAAQGKLMSALGDTAHNSMEATRQAATDRANKIKAVLTPEQWKQFEAMGR